MDWLNTLYLKIEAQKLQIEKANRNLQVLFKSWPNQEQEAKLEVEKKSGTSIDHQASDPANHLTEEEKEGVNLVDRLLQKAQKARQVQQKLEEPKRSRPQKDVPAKLPDKDKHQAKKELSTKNGFVKADEINKPVNKSSQDSRPQPRQINDQSERPSQVDKSSKGTSNTGCKGSVKDERSVSRSAGRRVAPAHVSAPFQTNPRLVNSKLKTEYSSSTGRVLSAAKNSKIQAGRGRGTQSAPMQRKGASNPPGSGSNKTMGISKVSGNKIETKQEDIKQSEGQSTNTNLPSPHLVNETSGEVSDNYTAEPIAVDKTDIPKESEICAGVDNLQIEGDICFRLAKDGHTLSVPSKYKKLVGMNRKLRQKLFTQKVTTKVDSPRPNEQFPCLLQQTFEDPEAVKYQMVYKQAQYLVNVYRNLRSMLQSLNLHTLNGNSSIEEVLIAKKYLEYILTKFHETEVDLHAIDLGMMKSIPVCHRNYQRKTVSGPEYNSSNMWNHVNGLGNNQPRLLKYKSFRQLERYTSLIHRTQLLQYQLDAMDKMAELCLPLLQTLDPTSSEFIQVLRCSYSMLSTNPNRVPVIVKDSIQDDTAGNQDEPSYCFRNSVHPFPSSFK